MNTTLPQIERNYPLARLTTVRTGGAAQFFARVDNEDQLRSLLSWAQEEGHAVGVVGSGSNLLVSDQGFEGVVVKLVGELAQIEPEGDNNLLCGGGARLPAAAAKTARLGLTGLEFGVSIPGTVGGAVKMNANAYGGQLSKVLVWVRVVSGAGVTRREPSEFDFSYRRSNLQAGEVVSQALFRLVPAEQEVVKGRLGELRQARRDTQPSGIKTFGSTFKNPDASEAGGRTAGQLLEAAGCNGLQQGAVRFAPKHANFVENTGKATTAEVIALMAEGRRRVFENSGVILEPEVQLLGDVTFPPEWELE